VSGARSDGDLLVPPPADRLVSVAYLAAALRRRRRVVVSVALAGLFLGIVLTFAVPTTHSANAVVLLQFPAGSDPARAMDTDLSLLKTHSVAQSAARSLADGTTTDGLLGSYRGKTLSDGVLQITADGGSDGTAVQRARAVTNAFLAFRKSVYDQQLHVALAALTAQQNSLQSQIATLTAEIGRFNALTAPAGTLDGLLSQRSDLQAQVQSLQGTAQTDSVATTTIVKGSRIIDTANAVGVSMHKKAVLNAASGLVAGLVLGAGGVVLLALITTKVRRRVDVATALAAPVALSVGHVMPDGPHRVLHRGQRRLDESTDNLRLVVRHLRSSLAAAPDCALVLVAIDTLPLAAVAARVLREQIEATGGVISVVNESGIHLPEDRLHPGPDTIATVRSSGPQERMVLVLSALDPLKGADHLREWASDALVLVTAGRSSATKLRANATMIRAAGLHLRSAILLDADPTDDSLGVFDDREVVSSNGLRPVGVEDAASQVRSS
jgi:uncharacterized protein involved in exopolysaccharide biosynthesis